MNNTAQTELPTEEFLTIPAILPRLHISRRKLNDDMKSGIIPHVKLGKRVLFHWPSVIEALRRMQRGGRR